LNQIIEDTIALDVWVDKIILSGIKAAAKREKQEVSSEVIDQVRELAPNIFTRRFKLLFDPNYTPFIAEAKPWPGKKTDAAIGLGMKIGRNETTVTFRVKKYAGTLKVVDFVTGGVSFAQSSVAEFKTFNKADQSLQSNIDDLLAYLRRE
ncbi:MAG: hypothetical protein AAF203_05720, partial [Pseudomonadota bacterium]